MLTEVKNNLKFFLRATLCSAMSAMEYKASFLVSSIFMFVNNGFFLVIWATIFNANGKSLNGINFDTILYLWSLPVIGYGFAYFFFGGVVNINKYIISGAMDSYMIQPKHPLLNVLTSKCNFSAFGDLAYGVVLGVIVTKGNLLNLMFLILIGIFSGIFYIASDIIIRSISVWLGDTETIAKTYTNNFLIQFSIYPEQLFGGILKFILYTLVPVGYMAYMPINLLVKFDIGQLGIVLLTGMLYMTLAIFIFNKAMTKYESGNTISMRG